MTHVTCRLTAKNWDQLQNPRLGVIEYGLPLPLPFTFSLHKAEHGQETVCFPVGVLMNYEPRESNI